MIYSWGFNCIDHFKNIFHQFKEWFFFLQEFKEWLIVQIDHVIYLKYKKNELVQKKNRFDHRWLFDMVLYKWNNWISLQ